MVRRGRTAGETGESKFEPQKFGLMKRVYQPVDVLSKDEEQQVHQLSLRLLRDVGLKFLLKDSWPLLRAAGCEVNEDTAMVSFPPETVEEYLAKAPRTFEMPARNPQSSLPIGGKYITYGSASSAPNVVDIDRGRRPGSNQDFQDLVRLSQMVGSMHYFGGHPVEPIDMPPNTRHLTSSYDFCTLSDRVFRVYGIGRTRVDDVLEMTKIAHQIDESELCRAPRVMTVLNVNSPLLVDEPLLAGSMEMARRGQLNIVSPVALSGAMSPITLSGSVVQCNAECIGVIAFLQMVAPGAPCMYGVLSSPVDMKTGAPALGTPETVTATLANGQMARYYDLPQRVWLGSTSNAPDAQAAYETMFSLWAAQLCGAHMVNHAHGWMEGGLTTGYEKLILDAEMIQMTGALEGSIDFSDAEEFMAAIAEVGPGGHFLGSAHTMARYQDAFHHPMVSDWRAYEFWQAEGAPDAARRANRKWKELLANYQPPAIDEAVREQLADYVVRRRQEIGDEEID